MADLSKNEDDLDASNIYDLSTDEESIDDAQVTALCDINCSVLESLAKSFS